MAVFPCQFSLKRYCQCQELSNFNNIEIYTIGTLTSDRALRCKW